ncbi:S8 family serine peptidase [Rugamonas sp.]|uniref:S8 family serine peptidase n=1 Tax=Rugamonas sp. TaxID=1926287 RepID=UPI0025ED6901|nr:S8 family serine peptidase [Rugamonas sp.]
MVTIKALKNRRLTLLLMAAMPLLAAVQPARADDLRRAYIVQLADQPLAAYSGSVSGMRATKAAAGQRLDLASVAARQYRGYLSTQQDLAKALLPAAKITRQYQVVFNGFAALLTDAEVRLLKASGKAVTITPDERQHVVTNYTPTFLGLDAPGGLWEQLGGKEHAGEDIIVGVIDTGIWPENLSYADHVDGKGQPTLDSAATLAYGPAPTRWKGVCQTGEGFTAANCNNKLIGARYFDDGFRASGSVIHWSEFHSPRDSLSAPSGDGGHGTHTSSTAAGNGNVPALAFNGDSLGIRNGMAPRARLAMYKICWSYNDNQTSDTGVSNTCYNSDSVAAIEAAVSDGVDVLSYSISGGESPLDPVEQAFRHAVEAGVFVSAAGGNSGPVDAVSHISPWMATVAAATHDKTHTATVTLGNGQQFTGASLDAFALPKTAIVLAADAVAPGADASQAALCYRLEDDVAGAHPVAQLDPAKVAGKIVACQRGNNARVDKANAVKTAGGIGMILLDDGNGTVVDIYNVPTIHVNQTDGATVASYAAGPGATAALSTSALTPMTGPVLADFSSRGPNMFDPGVLKPDLAAPGVDILAGIAPSLSGAQRGAVVAGNAPAYSQSAYMSGTSMATPHVAGLAALLKQRHPGWSPAAVKSALMTTTRSVLPTALTGDQDGTLAWGQGAGLVQPNGAADPGLVYDIAAADYQKYLCDITGASGDCGLGALKGYALNLASISLPGVVGNQTVSRSVTNVGDKTAIYNASVTLDGFDVAVTPATLQLDPGETQSYKLSLLRTSAADTVWSLGELVWSDGEHKVRSPLQARYNAGVEAPALVSATTTSGSRDLEVQTGFDGKLSAVRGGMREYTRLAQTVTQAAPGSLESQDAVVRACVARGPGVKAVTLGIPNKTTIARFEISNRDTDGGADDDLDLALLDQSNNLIAYSGHEGSNESLALISPNMGVVKVCVLGYKVKNGVSTNFTLSYATAIPKDTKGSVKLNVPASVKQGGTADVGISWTGLEQGKHYLGGVQLLNQDGRALSVTEINIDTRDVTPATARAERRRTIGAR